MTIKELTNQCAYSFGNAYGFGILRIDSFGLPHTFGNTFLFLITFLVMLEQPCLVFISNFGIICNFLNH